MMEKKYLFLAFLGTAVCIALQANMVHATFPSMEIAHYEEAMASDRKDPEYLLINKLVGEKKYTEAMSILDKKIASSFNKSSAWMLKGMLLNEMGQYREALSALRKGYQIEARHPASQFSYCQIYRNLGSIEHSIRACKIAVTQHPDSWETHYENAQSLKLSGDMAGANKSLSIASTLNPKNHIFHNEIGNNYLYLNQMDNAETAFLKALKLNPKHLDSIYQLAYIYAVKKNIGKSKSYLNKLINSGERHPKVESAKSLLTLINDDQLNKIPSKIIPWKYHIGHSQSLYESKQYGPSLIEAQTAARLKPDDKKIQITLVRLSILLLRLGLIEKEVNNLIKLAKDDRVLQAKGYQELGDTNVMRGNIAEAKKHYEKAIILGDPYSIAKISLAELPKDDSVKGKPIIIDDYIIDPIMAWQKKGEIFDHFGMYDRALAIYSEVLKMDPNNLITKLNAAATYYKKADYEKSIALLERILISQPNHKFIIDHHILLAKAYVKKNDEKEAIINLEKVVKFKPKNINSILSDPAFISLKKNPSFKNLQQGN